VKLKISSNFTKSKNLTKAKSPPNGLNCSVQVSTGVEALIFLALVVLFLDSPSKKVKNLVDPVKSG
jgi:hypothetical protein